MNQKGFTLIEILAVIVVIGLILVIAIPKALEIIQESKQRAYDVQEELIMEAAKKYVNRNSYDLEWNGNIAIITLAELIADGLIKSPVKNPLTGTNFDEDATVVVFTKETNTKYSYRIGFIAADNCFTFATGVISSYDEVNCSTDLIIPSEINATAVTTIAASTFINKNLTSVIIPPTVTAIGNYAFQSNLLTSLSIPASVTSIGVEAFTTNSLASITVANGSTTIGNFLLTTLNNNFRDSYTTGGAGTYAGTQTGTWTKIY